MHNSSNNTINLRAISPSQNYNYSGGINLWQTITNLFQGSTILKGYVKPHRQIRDQKILGQIAARQIKERDANQHPLHVGRKLLYVEEDGQEQLNCNKINCEAGRRCAIGKQNRYDSVTEVSKCAPEGIHNVGESCNNWIFRSDCKEYYVDKSKNACSKTVVDGCEKRFNSIHDLKRCTPEKNVYYKVGHEYRVISSKGNAGYKEYKIWQQECKIDAKNKESCKNIVVGNGSISPYKRTPQDEGRNK